MWRILDKIKIMLFSGFLGSGKTTTMVSTAKYLKQRGIKVSVITNDLGENLVDTEYARMNGVGVSEIPNGCLCHDVTNFIEVVKQLNEREHPDIIFAEPVGSCVDLVHNVYQRIDDEYRESVELLPFTCVIDPIRYKSIYMEPENNTFSEEATYMYKKQLEDGDIFLLNKCDLISDDEKERIINSLRENFPQSRIVPVCSIRQENYKSWTEEFLNNQKPSLRKLDIDWDYVMSGAGKMGWYNNILRFKSNNKCDYNKVVKELVEIIQEKFGSSEIAHLKVMGYDGNEFVKLALTSTNQDVKLTHKLETPHNELSCNINIRALIKADEIDSIVNNSVKIIENKYELVH